MILGGFAANVLQRIVAWGDGWSEPHHPGEVAGEPGHARPTGEGCRPRSLDHHHLGLWTPADRDLIKRLLDAGANRVIVRPPAVGTESEMAAQLTRIAEAVLR